MQNIPDFFNRYEEYPAPIDRAIGSDGGTAIVTISTTLAIIRMAWILGWIKSYEFGLLSIFTDTVYQ